MTKLDLQDDINSSFVLESTDPSRHFKFNFLSENVFPAARSKSSYKNVVERLSDKKKSTKKVFYLDIKEDLKNEMKKIFIKIAIDEEEDIYKSETLYFKNETYISTKEEGILCSPMNKRASKRAHEYFKYFVKTKQNFYKESEIDFIDNEFDYQFLDDENNYYKTKQKENTNLSDCFNKLLMNHKDYDAEFLLSIYRRVDDILYKISLCFGTQEKNGKNINGVFLRLYKTDGSQIDENFLSYESITLFFAKMAISNLLPRHVKFEFIVSLKMFFENIFI